MACGYRDRELHLARKMLDGAKALYDFFEELKTDRTACPESLSVELAEKYELTQNQRSFLERVATRASRAQGIVRYLEDRFGLNSGGEFVDPRGLYSLLYRTKRPPKHISASSYNVAIGFVRDKWSKKNYLGFINGTYLVNPDQLNVPLEETVHKLEHGKSTACADLSFSIAGSKYIEKTAAGKVLANERDFSELREAVPNIFGLFSAPSKEEIIERVRGEAEEIRQRVVKHELRHIFDGIIGTGYIHPFSEFVADLYTMRDGASIGLLGLNRDLNKFLDRLNKSKGTLSRLEELAVPNIIIESARRSVERHERVFNESTQEARSMVSSLKMCSHNVYYPVVSYVISTIGGQTHLGKFGKRIKLLASAVSFNRDS